MKAKLIFNLDNPDDGMAHLRCVNSLKMACALFDINQIRSKVERMELDSDEALERVFELIHESMEEVDLDSLIN